MGNNYTSYILEFVNSLLKGYVQFHSNSVPMGLFSFDNIVCFTYVYFQMPSINRKKKCGIINTELKKYEELLQNVIVTDNVRQRMHTS